MSLNEIYRALRQRRIHFERRWQILVRNTVTAYLAALDAAGHIDRLEDGRYHVVGDAAALAAHRQKQEQLRPRADAEERACLRTERIRQLRERQQLRAAWRAQLATPPPDPASYSAAPPPGATPSPPAPPHTSRPTRCSRCGGPLAEALAAHGRHVLC